MRKSKSRKRICGNGKAAQVKITAATSPFTTSLEAGEITERTLQFLVVEVGCLVFWLPLQEQKTICQ